MSDSKGFDAWWHRKFLEHKKDFADDLCDVEGLCQDLAKMAWIDGQRKQTLCECGGDIHFPESFDGLSPLGSCESCGQTRYILEWV